MGGNNLYTCVIMEDVKYGSFTLPILFFLWDIRGTIVDWYLNTVESGVRLGNSYHVLVYVIETQKH